MRKLAFGLILCLLLSGCGGSPAEEPAEAQGPPVQVIGPEEDWREVYVKFLEDLCEEERAVLNVDRPDYDPNLYPAQVGSLSQEYFLYDLDWDGVPELVLRFGWDSWDTRFYTVRDGEVTEVAERRTGTSPSSPVRTGRGSSCGIPRRDLFLCTGLPWRTESFARGSISMRPTWRNSFPT